MPEHIILNQPPNKSLIVGKIHVLKHCVLGSNFSRYSYFALGQVFTQIGLLLLSQLFLLLLLKYDLFGPVGLSSLTAAIEVIVVLSVCIQGSEERANSWHF